MAVIDTVTSPTGEKINIVDQQSAGFNSLDAESFLKMLIVQLQNQDPTEPVSNEALLSQLSEMRSLQGGIELQETLKSVTDTQAAAAKTSFASSAAALIGRYVEADITVTKIDPVTNEEYETTQSVSGKVERAILKGDKAYVIVDGKEVQISDIRSVSNEVVDEAETDDSENSNETDS